MVPPTEAVSDASDLLSGSPTCYEDLSEVIDDRQRPWLDRHDLDEEQLTPRQREWRSRGALVLPGFVPGDLIDAYARRVRRYHDVGGFASPTPYEHVPELRAIALHAPLRAVIEDLIGEEMILHLNLTGWVTTGRRWHQDDYLNSAHVNGWYLATWVALDDVHPDSGPFQYIPGSHRWPVLRRELVMRLMTPEQAEEDARSPQSLWTAYTQDAVSEMVEKRRIAEGIPVESFVARRGDVLVWHACLQHRGSPPRVRDRDRWRIGRGKARPRKSLISHYTARSHWEQPDEALVADPGGGRYAGFGFSLDHLLPGGRATLRHRLRKRAEWLTRVR